MNKEKAYSFWESMAHQKDLNEKSVKFSCSDNFISIDCSLILKFASKNSTVLDLGSGTGLIVNNLAESVKSVDCLEAFPEFSKFIKPLNNISIINKNVFDFETEKKFDVVTMFGFMQYFDAAEASVIYRKTFNWLSEGGVVIVKNQFGVEDDVLISGWSEALKKNYYSSYRFLEHEKQILHDAGFVNVDAVDIYPKEANKYDNTHFYALVAHKD